MALPYSILLLIPLAAMVVSDFRRREVAVVWLALFAVGSVAVSLVTYGVRLAVFYTLLNCAVVLMLTVGIWVYLMVKTGKATNPLKKHAGSGDFLFILTLTPLFDPRTFLLFLICSFIVSLVWWALRSRAGRIKTTVPLVGTIGIAFMIYNISLML